MTREEIIERIEKYIPWADEYEVDIEVLTGALELLKKDPCDDAISRQAVLDIINFEDKWLLDAKGHNAGTEIAFSGMKSKVSALPPVNPQEPKTGHWIEHPTEEDYSVCSRCGIGSRRMEHGENADGTKYIDIYSYRFCPYCGCRMVEPQESEEV